MDYKDNVKKWLAGNFDDDTKNEIIKLQQSDPMELEDAFYKNLEFGTGGLRGIMGAGTNRINKYTVGMATQGLADYIKKYSGREKNLVCISFDSRNNSEYFANIAAGVLSANGIDVKIFSGIRPTPELSYSIRLYKAVAGIMITASHNPKEYSGYKVFWEDGAQITSPVDKAIVEHVNKITDPSMVRFVPGTGAGKIEKIGRETDEQFMKDILSLTLSPESVKRHKDLKIVYTPLHGCGAVLVPECLRRMGFDNVFVVEEQMKPDGNFPTVESPNPEEPSAMKMALEKAEKVQADIIMATDPDADRIGLGIRDKTGKMILLNGNQTASLLTYYILTRKKERGELLPGDYIVKTIVTTGLLADIASSLGIKCHDVLTGFKYIAEIVKINEGRGRFLCGGEESFGFNVGEYVRDKDAQVTAAMIADCASWASDKGMSLYDLLQEIYRKFGYRKESLSSLVRKGKKGSEEIKEIMDGLRTSVPKFPNGEKVVRTIDYMNSDKTGLPKSDVLQFFGENGSIVTVRPSGTEPKIKFYFSASGDDADAIIDALKLQFID